MQGVMIGIGLGAASGGLGAVAFRFRNLQVPTNSY